jgi:hypothetical protein
MEEISVMTTSKYADASPGSVQIWPDLWPSATVYTYYLLGIVSTISTSYG